MYLICKIDDIANIQFLQLASSDVNESDLTINLNINVNGLDKGNVVPGNP